ncbi:unnamed protein product [Cunninghamella blakesleeana]
MGYNIDDTVIDWRELANYWADNCTTTMSPGNFIKYLATDEFFSGNKPGHMLPLVICTHKKSGYASLQIQRNHAEMLASNIGHDLDLYEPLVIPEHLLEASHQYNIKVCNMHDKAAYTKATKEVKKVNKRINKTIEAKENYQRAKDYVKGRKYVFVSLDIEAYELDHSILLEIGWSLFDSQTNQFQDQHYMMEPYSHLRNGRYVEDQKLQFQFGTSVWCTLDQALDELYKDLAWATYRDGGFILVGHGLKSDILYLKKQHFTWPKIKEMDLDGNIILDPNRTSNVHDSSMVTIINTDDLFGCHINDLHNPPSLGKCLHHFHIDHSFLHNAGNDAHYTLDLMLALTSN